MGDNSAKARGVWRDRFTEPAADDLRAEYNKQIGVLIDLAREKLRDHVGDAEEVTWKGFPWRWTLTYPHAADSHASLAYLILDPERPLIALTLSTEMVEALPMHRMKKHVRDGVLMSSQVAGVYWAEWEIQNKTQLLDVLELARRKHKLLEASLAASAG